MIEIRLTNGKVFRQAETAQEWLDMQPAATLRRMFAGDVDGMQKFNDRLRELDARHDKWLREKPARVFWRKWGWLIEFLAGRGFFDGRMA